MDIDDKSTILIQKPQAGLTSLPPRAGRGVRRFAFWAGGSLFLLLILAAIIVPNFLKSCGCGGFNEASAAASVLTVSTANITYSETYKIGFAGSLAQLAPPSSSCATMSSACADLIDDVLASGVKTGYKFTYLAPNATPTVTAPNTTFSLVVTPPPDDSKNTSTFCLDQTNVLLRDRTGVAKTASAAGCAGFAGDPL